MQVARNAGALFGRGGAGLVIARLLKFDEQDLGRSWLTR